MIFDPPFEILKGNALRAINSLRNFLENKADNRFIDLKGEINFFNTEVGFPPSMLIRQESHRFQIVFKKMINSFKIGFEAKGFYEFFLYYFQ